MSTQVKQEAYNNLHQLSSTELRKNERHAISSSRLLKIEKQSENTTNPQATTYSPWGSGEGRCRRDKSKGANTELHFGCLSVLQHYKCNEEKEEDMDCKDCS